MKNLSIFIFAFALCMIISDVEGRRTTILIRNGLAYKKWLKVHCASGDDDMGVHYLKPGSPKDYDFSFDDSIMRNTLFWCTLSKGPDYKVSKRFDAYVQNSGKPHGGSYNYVAKDDGIYHSNLVEFKLTKVYSWN
ncbi:unnamed protein product [Thlaspi arvense]|uniref:S-protein homolog n=1 Tax=Thlaspi arvense TaxID=13288 RepID=A0AAU9RHA4_THLAR|nr:unnamed protein product [Thlaspi arvense]